MDKIQNNRLLLGAVIGAAALLRLWPHPWNVTPLTALALFSGAYLRSREGPVLFLGALAVSDLLLGWHATIPFTWGSFLLILWFGRRLGGVSPGLRLVGASLAASTFFYLVSNAGVFLATDLYPKTWQGLWQCYVLALPFFRNALVGDAVYSLVLFGLYHWAQAYRTARAT